LQKHMMFHRFAHPLFACATKFAHVGHYEKSIHLRCLL
jgi:hypothetical protein